MMKNITGIYHHRTQATDAQGIHINEMMGAFRRRGVDIRMVALVRGEALGRDSRPGGAAKVIARLPGAVYEFLEIGFNLVGIIRLFQAVRRHRPAFIYERYSIYNLAGLVVSKLTSVPLILEVNAPLAYEKSLYGTLCFPKLAQAVETLIVSRAFRTLAVTRVLKDMLVAQGAFSGRICVVPNGINMADFQETPPVRQKNGKIVLGFTGWFRDWHGLLKLIARFAREGWQEKGLHLLLVGDGPLRPKMEAMVEQYNLSAFVTITGGVGRNQLLSHLSLMDIALQPAATAYASPMKLIEYMAAGKAIVAPDQPNIRELLTHEKNALLFPPGDFEAMAGFVEQLAASPELCARLGQAARQTVETRNLTWDHNADQVLALL